MMEQLYFYLYLATFVSLSLWFLFKNNRERRLLLGNFFLGTLAIGTGLFLFVPSIQVSGLQFLSHLVVLFFGGFFLNTFSGNKFIFLSLLTFCILGLLIVQPVSKGVSNRVDLHEDLLDANPKNELLLELKEGHLPAELQKIVDLYQLHLVPAFFPKDKMNTDLDDYYLIDIPKKQLVKYDQILETLQSNHLVDHVEVNEIIVLDPLEAMVGQQKSSSKNTYANDPEINKLWGFESMNVEALYALIEQNNIRPKKKAKIAIIDTGVDALHEDIADNFVSTGARHNKDDQGHGTHCAGIAAAVSNNRKGIASLVPNNRFVTVTSIKVFGKFGSTTQQKIIEGMLLAVDNGADVLSMSLGGPSSGKSQRAYRQAVKYAQRKGAIVVVAAGNENTNAAKRVPASVEGVITVSAINNQLNKASFSNHISQIKMGVSAPGVQIYSCIPSNKYAFFNGTSMATPYVAGLLGLMKSLQPQLTTEEAYRVLKSTGITTNEVELTGKLIHPAEALKVLLKK